MKLQVILHTKVFDPTKIYEILLTIIIEVEFDRIKLGT